MTHPTAADWPGSGLELDEKCAHAHFFGKTLAEAEQLFVENSIIYQEDMCYMPGSVFGYYIKAYLAYLMSDAAQGDADGASCFVSLMRFMSEHKPHDLEPVWADIEPVLAHVIEHQRDFYEADWFPYRDFHSAAREIKERGFPISVEVDRPEIVPDDIPLELLPLFAGSFPWSVASQILAKADVRGLTVDSRKQDLLDTFGSPESTGGGWHPELEINIPDWIRFRFRDCLVRFQLENDSIVSVNFMPAAGDELMFVENLTERLH